MIDNGEIAAKADELGVGEADVKKDYLFGWILAGIYTISELREHLVLKGGNCLRKAYLESSRFSPDLDFETSRQVSAEYVARELATVMRFVEKASGVQFSEDKTNRWGGFL